MKRKGGRGPQEIRRLKIKRNYTQHAHGSVLLEAGQTRVLCTAWFDKGVPKWREGSGRGWVTAEYDMLPSATSNRRSRNRGKIDGRTQEIQRLIGRALRCVVNMPLLGENTIYIDCDVLQADGGTRTASITGSYVAIYDAVRCALRNKWLSVSPISDAVAAVSVGKIGANIVVDLDYEEDAAADVDLNLAMTGSGRFVEIQGTGEQDSFSRTDLDKMIKYGTEGIRQLITYQKKLLRIK